MPLDLKIDANGFTSNQQEGSITVKVVAKNLGDKPMPIWPSQLSYFLRDAGRCPVQVEVAEPSSPNDDRLLEPFGTTEFEVELRVPHIQQGHIYALTAGWSNLGLWDNSFVRFRQIYLTTAPTS